MRYGYLVLLFMDANELEDGIRSRGIDGWEPVLMTENPDHYTVVFRKEV